MPTVHQVELADVNIEGLSVVGGLDISFREDGNGDEGIAVLAVLSFPQLKLLYKVSRVVSLHATPYIPSFLSFREAAPLASLLDDVRASGRPIPQLLFVDGNGRFHAREAGSAVAIGLLTSIPTIGLAKEYHPLTASLTPPPLPSSPPPPIPTTYLTSQKLLRQACRTLLSHRGSYFRLPNHLGTPLGAAVLTSPSKTSTNPVFVSSGHRVGLETAIKLTLVCSTEARIPEPIRMADRIGREEARELWGVGGGGIEDTAAHEKAV